MLSEAEQMKADARDGKRLVWEEAFQAKKNDLKKTRQENYRNQREMQNKQQVKPQVLRIVTRINYALHRGGIRTINGRKVKDIRTLFQAMDVDCSGCISKPELEEGLKKLKVNAPQHSIDLLMQELDSDFGGSLVLDELLKWWQQAEVVQAAAQAKEDLCNVEHANDKNKPRRRMRASASHVVGQLQFILKGGKFTRKLFGKEITDARSFFQALDSDGTGKIHACEIAAGLKRLDIVMTDGDIQALVDTIDSDSSGNMDLTEVNSWLEYQLVAASVAMQIRDCFSEKRTLFGQLVTDAASLFDAIDLDGNGYLEFDELVKGLRNLQLSVGFPDIDGLLTTLGKDRSSLIDREELIWVLDRKSQMDRIRN